MNEFYTTRLTCDRFCIHIEKNCHSVIVYWEKEILNLTCSYIDPDGPRIRDGIPWIDRGQRQRRDENAFRGGQERSRSEQSEPAIQSDQQFGDRGIRNGPGQTPAKHSKNKTFPS